MSFLTLLLGAIHWRYQVPRTGWTHIDVVITLTITWTGLTMDFSKAFLRFNEFWPAIRAGRCGQLAAASVLLYYAFNKRNTKFFIYLAPHMAAWIVFIWFHERHLFIRKAAYESLLRLHQSKQETLQKMK